MTLANPGNVRPMAIHEEMRASYLDYAMSVIVARALPDVRDGLKPVHRRILFAMHGMGLRPGSAYKKSAGVVGEVLGKYHPHGDAPVYDALVRMAQDFSMRYPLVDGQGNFGSVDDDPPAAMRYTEARLAAIAEQMLLDIDRNTVDFVDNYDGSEREPGVLPARLPNLLVNGSSGIAVGLATNIPPHNLREVCDAIVYLADHPDAPVEDLMRFVQGPDFPTAGIIMGREGIRQACHTGRGRVTVRARAVIEDADRSGYRQRIVVTELPYQVNKATLVEKIASLAKDKHIEGISEIRDESDREGLRVVVELGRGAVANRVLNNLYQHTAMQSAFHVNMVALVDGQPRVLTLKAALQHFIEFRRVVVRRRGEFDLGKARERAHILEGLRIALQHLDAVIRLIRGAADVDAARTGLMTQFGLSEAQAQAILDMQLRRLAALERQKIEEEFQELQKRIADLEALLADPARVLAVIKDETRAMRKEFGDQRRTEITDQEAGAFTPEESIQHADVVIALSDRGYLKRLPIEQYRLQRRGGKGVRGQETREGDAVQQIVVADTHDWLLFFTNRGRVYRERVFEVRQDSSRQTRGTHLKEYLELGDDERVTAVVAITDPQSEKFIVMATRRGEVKRMKLRQFANIRRNGLTSYNLNEDDQLLGARLAETGMSLLLVKREGLAAQIPVDKIPLRQGRGAGGVKGILVVRDDEVVAMDIASPGHQLLVLSERGFGKQTPVELFRTTNRGAKGVIALKITDRTGPVAAAVVTGPEVDEVLVGSAKAMVYRTSLDEIRSLSRKTQGVKIMTKLTEDDQVISASAFKERNPPQALPVAVVASNGHANGTAAQLLLQDDDVSDDAAPEENDGA